MTNKYHCAPASIPRQFAACLSHEICRWDRVNTVKTAEARQNQIVEKREGWMSKARLPMCKWMVGPFCTGREYCPCIWLLNCPKPCPLSSFSTFFNLPDFYWRGFFSKSLSSKQLIAFALLTYVLAPLGIKWALMRHLVTSPAGGYLVRAYLGKNPSYPNSNWKRPG